MRVNIVIDDRLMEDTLRATGLGSKSEVVGLALRTLLQLRRQEEIRQYRGKIPLEYPEEWRLNAFDARLEAGLEARDGQ